MSSTPTGRQLSPFLEKGASGNFSKPSPALLSEMEPPQKLKSLDGIAMKSLQGLVLVELIGERRVHRADAFAFLADQKEVRSAGKSAQCYLLRRIILGNRCHIQVVGEQYASESKALSSTIEGIFHVKGSRAIRDRQPDRPHGRSSYS